MSNKLLLAFLLMAISAPAAAWDDDLTADSTFSIIARDVAAGELGMAVQSKAHAIGSRAISAQGGLAVIAHQAMSDPMYGQIGLQLLRRGYSPQQALDFMVRGDEGRDGRQVAILDMQGRTAAWTGKNPADWKGHRCTPDYCVEGNTLAGPEVLDGMVKSFEAAANQPLAERLLAALDGGQAAGGDRRGMEAAALVIVKPLAGAAGFSDREVDIRVDDHRTPIPELRRVYNVLRSNQMSAQAMAAFRGNRAEEALRIALAARDLSPDNDNTWVTLAYLYMEAGRRSECFEALRKAIEVNPANKTQLPRNARFEPIRLDPDFQRIFN
jgi:uncharacterized Ntn-hydrolase superfamily protein